MVMAEQAAATALANVVMGRVDRELGAKYRMWKSIQRESASLRTDLVMLTAAMDDQQSRIGPRRTTAVERAVGEEMRELTHDIEDCIERFLHRATFRAGASRAQRAAHVVRTFRTRLRFAGKIMEFKGRVQEARQRVLSSSSSSADEPSRSANLQEAARGSSSGPVGIAEATSELRALLDVRPNGDGEAKQRTSNTSARLRVVAVVGFGGSGKTTLARAVYDSVLKEGTLPCAWVDGHSLDDHKDASAGGIINRICDQLRFREQCCSATCPLELEYLNHRENRRFIVIDDIKTEHMKQWDDVRNAFKDNDRILVTTATQSVANRCSNHPHQNKETFGYVYNMRPLGKDDSMKIALLGRCTPELKQGAEKLLTKCGGLPLALHSVACRLSDESVPTGEFCSKLCPDLGAYLDSQDVDEPNFARLRGVLRENYTGLSNHTVRTCLLYLGIFPMDRPLKRSVIVRRWLAEGYARQRHPLDRRNLSVADENFQTFINQTIIIQPHDAPVGGDNANKDKSCRTHGIMHVFMLHKSMSEKFIMPFAFGAQHKKVRHLFIHASSNGADSRITTPHDIDLSRVRSLTVSGDAGDAISHLHKYKITRVLDLEGCSDVKDCHVQHICRIWNLRYLSLGPNITKIPKQIARLKLLETLDVSKTKVTLLPVEAIGLPCLVHLIGKFKLQGPVKTERLPKESMLETLSGFIADKDQGFLQLIGHMKKLNKVKIWCECDPEEAKHGEVIRKYIEAPMVVEDNARSLSLDFQGPLTTALDQVCKSQEAGNTYHLSSLKILTHGSTSSSSPTVLHRFIALFRDLTKICLSTSTLTHGLQSALGDMRCLHYLKLVVANNIDGSGGLIIGGGKFGSLSRLCLVLKAMEPPPAPVLTIQDGARPEIVSLRLICEHLVGLSGVDITRLPELKEVALHPGVAEETRQAWEAEARSHPNMPNVLAIAANDPEEKSIIIQGENGNESRNQRHRLLRGNLCGKTHKDADSQ